jgi:hypothetical protein
LILDFEEGTNSIDALKVNINSFETLREVLTKIKEAGYPYKYIAVDTVTALERMCEELALKLYLKTPMGKGYKGDILDLPKGGGYYYLRKAILTVLKEIGACTKGSLILVGHLRNSMIEKDGKEFTAKEVDLTGKISSIVCAEVDATAYAYREKDKLMLNFENSEQLSAGSRQEHLFGKQIILSEKNEKGEIIYHWDKIFID